MAQKDIHVVPDAAEAIAKVGESLALPDHV
jgi:hypothetical protein